METLHGHMQREMQSCRGAVVRVEAADEHGMLSGTGFFVDPSGILYTSYTVAGESKNLLICRGDTKVPAHRLVADRRSGIAILQTEASTPSFLPLGRSGELETGSPLMAFGFPLDLPLSPTFGVLGGQDRKYLGRYFATTHLRANVPVQRGEGGAPLMNMKGEVVGILISSLDQGSGTFALPIEAAEKVRQDYNRFGKLRPGWVGLRLEAADQESGGSTAKVAEIFPGAPAAKAGVLEGDTLLQVAGHKITSPEDMIDAAFFLTAEDPVKINILRGGEALELEMLPGDPPQAVAPARALGAAGDGASGEGLQLESR